MSQWGLWDDELDPVLMEALSMSYLRRKGYEARLIAQALGATTGMPRVRAHELLAEIGANI